MAPNPKLPTSLYAQIARQMALVNIPAMRYVKNPAFAYMRSPTFRVVTEHIRLAHELAKPHTLAMQAYEAQLRQAEAMTLQIARWRRQRPTAPQPADAAVIDDADVAWSTYPADPNFGFRHIRWAEPS